MKQILGTELKPRLSVFRSHKHIYAQLIDDINSKTLAFSSTLDKSLNEKLESTSTQEAAFLVGQEIAKKAEKKEIVFAIFDRGQRPYHGRIKSVADGARSQGLTF
uniref:Large ribosomal subunit protein uL18c n=1 Tax=Mallomonas splendens TaxID=52552 RepID=A0A3G2QZJ3_9STRA|nr:ribosomal protein L18 [Mallomonas splendens]AYO28568.1 ribosomal protein L18 [Mallomonas splendens]